MQGHWPLFFVEIRVGTSRSLQYIEWTLLTSREADPRRCCFVKRVFLLTIPPMHLELSAVDSPMFLLHFPPRRLCFPGCCYSGCAFPELFPFLGCAFPSAWYRPTTAHQQSFQMRFPGFFQNCANASDPLPMRFPGLLFWLCAFQPMGCAFPIFDRVPLPIIISTRCASLVFLFSLRARQWLFSDVLSGFIAWLHAFLAYGRCFFLFHSRIGITMVPCAVAGCCFSPDVPSWVLFSTMRAREGHSIPVHATI